MHGFVDGCAIVRAGRMTTVRMAPELDHFPGAKGVGELGRLGQHGSL
jgi:hypothetical protein